MLDAPLHGILAATVTPFRDDGTVDEESLRSYLGWLAQQGVHAVVMHADSGEGHALTPAERETIIGIAAEEVGGRLPIIAGLIAQSTAEAVELGRIDRDAGADALMVFPPTSFLGSPLPPEVPVAYHAALADEVGLPLVAFQLQSALGGVEYTPEALRQVLAIDAVVAIKESTFDAMKFRQTMRLVRSLDRRISYLSGNDNFIFESLALGADGCLIGNGTITCREQVEMYEAVRAGDLERGGKLAEQIEPLVDVVYAPPIRNYRARLKHVLVLEGVLPSDRVRPPLPPLPPDEAEAVRAAFLRAGGTVAGGAR
jgi:4-hydroxy-tetrahydrodipicolinate synthase